eukprot:12895424-Prorocentrum_lima.AAC.1
MDYLDETPDESGCGTAARCTGRHRLPQQGAGFLKHGWSVNVQVEWPIPYQNRQTNHQLTG